MLEIDGFPLWEYYEGYYLEDPDEMVEMEGGEDATDAGTTAKGEVATGGGRIHVWYQDDTHSAYWDFVRQDTRPQGAMGWDAEVVDFLAAAQHRLKPWLHAELSIRTKHKRNGQIFRGHPKFRQNGLWNDWVLVDWGASGCCPAEIWCFLDLRELPKRGIKVN